MDYYKTKVFQNKEIISTYGKKNYKLGSIIFLNDEDAENDDFVDIDITLKLLNKRPLQIKRHATGVFIRGFTSLLLLLFLSSAISWTQLLKLLVCRFSP